MTDIRDIKSPCQSICILEEDEMSRVEYCIGCFRTVLEIQDWYDMTDRQRESITNSLPHREKNLT